MLITTNSRVNKFIVNNLVPSAEISNPPRPALPTKSNAVASTEDTVLLFGNDRAPKDAVPTFIKPPKSTYSCGDVPDELAT